MIELEEVKYFFSYLMTLSQEGPFSQTFSSKNISSFFSPSFFLILVIIYNKIISSLNSFHILSSPALYLKNISFSKQLVLLFYQAGRTFVTNKV